MEAARHGSSLPGGSAQRAVWGSQVLRATHSEGKLRLKAWSSQMGPGALSAVTLPGQGSPNGGGGLEFA